MTVLTCRRTLLGAALALASLALAPIQAVAQNYPDKSVEIVLAFGTGGVSDIIARTLAPRLEEKLGQRFIVQNMPGAGGTVAMQSVAEAGPDGYTLLKGLLHSSRPLAKLRLRRFSMPSKSPFKHHRFPQDVILCAVRWYLRYPLSYQDVVDLLVERGVSIYRSTVYRWVQKFGSEMTRRTEKHIRRASVDWHVDETYIRVGGKWRGCVANFCKGLKRLSCGHDYDASAANCWKGVVPLAAN